MNAFEQLRDTETGEPIAPNPAFAARLRARVSEALGTVDPDLPIVQLPDRTHTVTTTDATHVSFPSAASMACASSVAVTMVRLAKISIDS